MLVFSQKLICFVRLSQETCINKMYKKKGAKALISQKMRIRVYGFKEEIPTIRILVVEDISKKTVAKTRFPASGLA